MSRKHLINPRIISVGSRGPRYTIDGLVHSTLTPIFAAARALHDLGHPDDDIVEWPGRMSASIGWARTKVVIENAKTGPLLGKYYPHPLTGSDEETDE